VTQPSPEKQATCWCGGLPTPSVHPLYGNCPACGTQVLLRQLSAEELKAFYTEGYWHEFVQNTYKLPSIEERAVNDFYDRLPFYFRMLLRYAPLPDSLLEIGCSHGGFLYYCRQSGVRHLDGIEVDANICAFAKKRFNLPSVIPGFFPDVVLPRDRYDVVAGFDVLEHFINPIEVMTAVAGKLDEKGICFFLTPCYRGEDRTWDRFRPDEHTFLYTEAAIGELYRRSGLDVIDIVPGLYSQDMYIIGKKHTATSAPATPAATPSAAPVSVVITTCNQPGLLAEALESCNRQSAKPAHVVVVNLGATDVSPVVRRFEPSLSITAVSCPAGSTTAVGRNKGLSLANQPWAAFLCDGEFLFPNHFETLLPFLAKSDCMAVYADSYRALQVVRGPGYFTFRNDLVFSSDFDPVALRFHNLFPLACAVVRRSCFVSVGLFDESLAWCSDWDFWIRFSRAFSAVHVPRITCEYKFRIDGSLLAPGSREAFVRDQAAVLGRYVAPGEDSDILRDPQRGRVPCERDPAVPYPRIDAFMTSIVKLVEQNQVDLAKRYYSATRPLMPPSPELDKFDTIMERLYKK
jgi:hypothetical protein